jgi:hypothetical protein
MELSKQITLYQEQGAEIVKQMREEQVFKDF